MPKWPSALLAVRRQNPSAPPRKKQHTELALGRKWFDCAECHQEQEEHRLQKSNEMVWLLKYNPAGSNGKESQDSDTWDLGVRMQEVQEVFPQGCC